MTNRLDDFGFNYSNAVPDEMFFNLVLDDPELRSLAVVSSANLVDEDEQRKQADMRQGWVLDGRGNRLFNYLFPGMGE